MSDVTTTWEIASRSAVRNAVEAIVHGAPIPRPGTDADDGAALALLRRKFGLTDFELRVVCVLVGVDAFTAEASPLIATMGGSQPTVQWCLERLSAPDERDRNWAAFLPGSTLRQAQLVRLGPSAAFSDSSLRLDEPVLHYLLGHADLDAGLAALAVVTDGDAGADVAGDGAVRELDEHLDTGRQLVSLEGCGPSTAHRIVDAVARSRGWGTTLIDARSLPDEHRQLHDLAQRWNRESVLHDLVLLLDLTHLARGESTWAVSHFLHVVRSPVVTCGLLPAPVHRATGEVTVHATHQGGVVHDPIERRRARARLAERARRLPRDVALGDVVLPTGSTQQLLQLVERFRQSDTVYGSWGFASGSHSGGVSALFAGPSGTGKTMAASAVANELGLELFRVDLAATISKYIGETEQNLARIFDAAERCGAMLLFDEADALFGKRSEVRDSHDRYANIEVSYLLQRIEQYTGVAVLTSNIKSALDHAFARRLSVVVDFPLPSASERAEIWRRSLPGSAPTRDLDPQQLARLSVSGGSIRNIALAAAFAAAAAGEPIGPRHVIEAARREYEKLGRQLSDAETRGWPA